MIFPSDPEIREYAAYEVRTRKIILEQFKQEYGRDPNELEIPELLRAAIIPIGLLPRQNGNSHPPIQQQQPGPQEQPKNQPIQEKPTQPQGGWKSEILRVLNEFPQNLERKSQSKIKIVREIPRSDWNDVKRAFEKEGWKYDWKEKAFLISEEARALRNANPVEGALTSECTRMRTCIHIHRARKWRPITWSAWCRRSKASSTRRS